MAEHGTHISDLVTSVALVDYPLIESSALALANQPVLARPVQGSAEELNALIPKPFFDYQRELQVRAKELAAVARRRDPASLSAAMGNTLQACISCHARYRREGESAPPADDPR
jgi:hypothetical protein